MKTIVLYHSQTGFTKRYAAWIAEATGAECLALSEAGKKDLNTYDVIVFGSWVCAGGISKIGWFKKRIPQWAGKKLIVFCVGGSPLDNPDVPIAMNRNFTEEERKRVHVFYCPGGINYEKMSAPSRMMMRMFVRTLKSKKNPTQSEQVMARVLASSYDISDQAYIAPILACLSDENSEGKS